MSISVTLAGSFLDRLGGMLAAELASGFAQSRPCGSCHDTLGPRITN